jgi:hypothetical protein
MPIPFALSLPQLAALLGAGAVAVASGESPTMKTIRKTRKARLVVSLGKGGVETGPPKQVIPTGPLPKQAVQAWNAKKKGKRKSKSAYGPKNDIHKKGTWFRFATYSDKWDRKLAKIRYYAKPNGALYVRKHGSAAKVGNLCWMARCPNSWYPGYGRAKALNVRLPALKSLLGPKADWKTLGSSFKSSIKAIPAVLKAAAVVVAGIYSGGSSFTKNSKKQVETVEDGIKGAIEPMKVAGNQSDTRVKASRVIVTAIRKQYILQMMDANPWAVKNGKLDIGANYMSNPQTWEDLFKPGDARPLLFNPPVSK